MAISAGKSCSKRGRNMLHDAVNKKRGEVKGRQAPGALRGRENHSDLFSYGKFTHAYPPLSH